MPMPTPRHRTRDKIFADEARRALELCRNLRAILCAIQLSTSNSTAPILEAIQNQRSVRSVAFQYPGTVDDALLNLACRGKLESLGLVYASPAFCVSLSKISPSVAPSLASLNVSVRLYVRSLSADS